MSNIARTGRRTSWIAKSAVLSVSYLALGLAADMSDARAQSAPAAQQTEVSSLPPVTITAPEVKRRASTSPAPSRANNGAAKRRSQTARRPEPAAAPKAFAVTHDVRTGTVGYYADSTSTATKTNTPLINVPQSVSVLTRDFIQDQSTHSITDLTRYVPGVAVHQGEGNRDELVRSEEHTLNSSHVTTSRMPSSA